MINAPYELAPFPDQNPLDGVEEHARHQSWSFTRFNDSALTLALPGQTTKYEVQMEWQEEFCALLIACSLPTEIKEASFEMASQAIERINEALWLGHFDMSNGGKFPTFRYTLLLRMVPPGTAMDLIADVLEIAQGECNRFYSTFKRAQAGDVRLHEDLDAAVFETVGEA